MHKRSSRSLSSPLSRASCTWSSGPSGRRTPCRRSPCLASAASAMPPPTPTIRTARSACTTTAMRATSPCHTMECS
uniref:Uncharacterized protein n=1 Tax=Arundo donax TaxID=35708 RepID=A0A0A9DDA5_ARUDO